MVRPGARTGGGSDGRGDRCLTRGVAVRSGVQATPDRALPTEVALLSTEVMPLAAAAEQLKAHTTAFLESYEPGVKLGSLQRFGAVDDEVRAAIRLPDEAPYAEQAAKAFGVSLEQKLRTSCCYFYVLPKVNACTTCPRFR